MTTNVIVSDRVEQQAYDMGFARFTDFEAEDEIDLCHFRDGAEYANHILPNLRALAGFEDSGKGTYQEDQDIVIIDAENLDDDPIAGDAWRASSYLEVLVDCWTDGARDALDPDAENHYGG